MTEVCVIFVSTRHASSKSCTWQVILVWCTSCHSTAISRSVDGNEDELGKLKNGSINYGYCL